MTKEEFALKLVTQYPDMSDEDITLTIQAGIESGKITTEEVKQDTPLVIEQQSDDRFGRKLATTTADRMGKTSGRYVGTFDFGQSNFEQLMPRTAASVNSNVIKQGLAGGLDVASLPFRALATGIGTGKMSDIGGESVTGSGFMPGWQRISESIIRSPLNALPFYAVGRAGAGVAEGLGAPIWAGRAGATGVLGSTASAADQYGTTGEVKALPTLIAGAVPAVLAGGGGYLAGESLEDVTRKLRVSGEEAKLIDKVARPGILEGRSAEDIRGKLGVTLDKKSGYINKVLYRDFSSQAIRDQLPDALAKDVVGKAETMMRTGQITPGQFYELENRMSTIVEEATKLPNYISQYSYLMQNLSEAERSGLDRLMGTRFSGINWRDLLDKTPQISKDTRDIVNLYDSMRGGLAETQGFVRNPELAPSLVLRKNLAELASGIQPYSGPATSVIRPIGTQLSTLAPQQTLEQYFNQ